MSSNPKASWRVTGNTSSRLRDWKPPSSATRDYAKQLEELQKAQAAGKPDDEAASQAAEGLLSDAELDELEAELPALAKVIRTQQAQITAMAGQVAELSKTRDTQKPESEEDDVAKAWNEALAKNQKAKYLDATLAPEVGQKFINVTAALYAGWDTMSDEDRAAAIVRQYEAVHGEVKVTAIATQPAAKPAPVVKTPAVPDVPVSMSGIPGGSAPAVDEAAALLSKSGAELTHDFMAMSSEQIEAALNRI